MNKPTKFLLIEPGKVPEIVEGVLTLEYMQKTVGGYIEAVYPFEDPVALICNEDGKFCGLKPNRALRDKFGKVYDIVCGNILIVGLTPTNFKGLSTALAWKYYEVFKIPEQFVRMGRRIDVIQDYTEFQEHL